MKKAAGVALACTLALAIPAIAGEVKGTVKEVDRAGRSFVLEDGTRLWVSESHLVELTAGEKVHVTYDATGDKKVVTELDRRTKGPEGGETSNLGTRAGAGN